MTISPYEHASTSAINPQRKARVTTFAVASLIMLFGIIVRVWGAWMFKHATNGDYGIVALMAKHIAEGTNFPVFFYGQAYMGSLEPWTSALLCKLAGFSGFAVCLGTALFGVFLLATLWLYAHESGGRIAGIGTILFCTIGPFAFFHYQVSPRGGYAALLFLSVLVIFLGVESGARHRNGDSSIFFPLLLGLTAGLGWWTHQLIVPAVLTAGICYVLLAWRYLTSKTTFAGLAGFTLGSAPFWAWNLLNEWKSFEFIAKVGNPVSLSEGVRYLFRHTCTLLDTGNAPLQLQIATLSVWGLVFLSSLFFVAKNLKKEGFTKKNFLEVAILIYICIFAAMYARSSFCRFNTPRYLLPLIPATAIMLGNMLSKNRPTAVRVLAAILVTIAVLAQVLRLKTVFDMKKQYEEFRLFALDLDAFLEKERIDGVYVPYNEYSLNYLLNEKFAFGYLKEERCQTIADKMESATAPAVWKNYGKVNEFLAATGGECNRSAPDGGYVSYGFRPTTNGYSVIPPDAIESNSCGTILFDGNLMTDIESLKTKQEQLEIKIKFVAPTTVSKVTMVFPPKNKALPNIEIFGVEKGKNKKTRLAQKVPPSYYFWSGPRPFHDGTSYRMERMFDPTEITELILCLSESSKGEGINIAELLLYAPGDPPDFSDENIAKLASAIKHAGCTRVYADRWHTAKLQPLLGSNVQMIKDPSTIVQDSKRPFLKVEIKGETGMVVNNENVGYATKVLDSAGIVYGVHKSGFWTLLMLKPESSQKKHNDLCWIGFSPAAYNTKD